MMCTVPLLAVCPRRNISSTGHRFLSAFVISPQYCSGGSTVPWGWAQAAAALCYPPALPVLPVWLEVGSATGLLRSSTQEGTDASRPEREAGASSEYTLTGLQRAAG